MMTHRTLPIHTWAGPLFPTRDVDCHQLPLRAVPEMSTAITLRCHEEALAMRDLFHDSRLLNRDTVRAPTNLRLRLGLVLLVCRCRPRMCPHMCGFFLSLFCSPAFNKVMKPFSVVKRNNSNSISASPCRVSQYYDSGCRRPPAKSALRKTSKSLLRRTSPVGELGYDNVDKNAHPVQVLPRLVPQVSQPVLSVAIADNAMACLLECHGVLCLYNDGHFRVTVDVGAVSPILLHLHS
ncbi:hypothetical protein BC629DRAFT_543509 [Irpex lacteus]|nr:hypothetical protein BC629DRAFT_543509 [Irpex lacteus]